MRKGWISRVQIMRIGDRCSSQQCILHVLSKEKSPFEERAQLIHRCHAKYNKGMADIHVSLMIHITFSITPSEEFEGLRDFG